MQDKMNFTLDSVVLRPPNVILIKSQVSRHYRVFKSFAQTHHMTAEAIFQQLRTHIANMGTANTIPMQTLISWQLHED